MKKLIFILLICSWHTIFSQFYTGSNTPFGQNRVQYNSFFWQSYDFQRFKIHFTKGGQKHAVYTAKTAHIFLKDIEKFLDFKLENKLHFIIYNSQSKFRQSNIGLNNDLSSNIGGTAKINGDKIFLYFNGSHSDFNKQIYAGIAELIIQKILFGSDIKQSVRNTSFTNMPEWFKDGLIDYLSTDWNTEDDGKLKNLILSGKAEKFHSLNHNEARLYAFGIWRYIDEIFGRNMIPNLIYMMKVSKSIESGFIYVLGVTVDMVQNDFIKYYKNIYSDDIMNCIEASGEKLNKIKSKSQRIYRQLKTNKSGDKIALVEHYLGQYKVKIYDKKKNKIHTALKGDYKLNRIPDLSHPVIAWHPHGKVLSIFEEKKGEILLNLYDTKERTKNIKRLLNLEKVLSCSYNTKGDKIIFSGVYNSQTDIYQYSILGNSQKQITNDLYDNNNPKYIPYTNNVIFESNRESLDESSPKIPNTNNIDLFQINTKTRKLKQLTFTPDYNEKYPQPIDKFNYHYLCDKNGIYNHFKKTVDSTISHIDTSIHYRYIDVIQRISNLDRNILEIDFAPQSNNFTFLYVKNKRYHFYTSKINKIVFFEDILKNTHFVKSKDLTAYLEEDDNYNESEININNYQFEIEKEILKKNNREKNNREKNNPSNFILPLKKIYNVNFTIGDFIMQLNPTFNNLAYQRYSSSGFKNAGFDGFTMIQAKDVFEDYKLTGGFKGPVQINNTGFIAIYENLKNRVDKKTQLSRQSFENFLSDISMDAPTIEKTITNDIKHQYSYPFSEVSSLRMTANLRYDKIITLSNSPNHLPVPTRNYFLAGSLLEYVFDATRPLATNINNGFKFKTWIEGYREINREKTDFFVTGLDLRNYQKIHRNIVFASRVAASTSFGSQRLIYYMGGVDGYLWARFDPSIQPDPEQNYQFQTIATPLRGFYQNARNGNSFIGISNELRIPLFSYFSRKPLKSDFLENFMLIGFNDIGAAWTGKNPYSSDNAFNNTTYNGHNYSVNVENQKEPVVYSYGFGIRSRIFGYYVRLDWGYGIDDHIVMPSIKQLSLSLDF